jgi:hypothetical protein
MDGFLVIEMAGECDSFPAITAVLSPARNGVEPLTIGVPHPDGKVQSLVAEEGLEPSLSLRKNGF